MRKIVCDCGKKIRVYEKTLGKNGKCPRCNKMITISAHIWQNPPEITQIAEYSIIREISRGNVGVLYEAIDNNEKRYAIKITYSDDIKQHEALTFEYDLLKNIKHHNIISYEKMGIYEGRKYLVMDFVDGKSLEDMLLTIPQQLPLTITLQLVKKIASILGYLHAHDIVHANLKPANILFTSNYEVVIINFSVARKINQQQNDTVVLGSPKYMAPEYRSGQQKLQPSCDIYSLGCVLFELLTGESVISDDDLLHSNFQISLHPSGLNAGIPAEVDAICSKTLHEDPTERYTNISPLVYDIETFLGQENKNLSVQLQNFFHEYQHPLVYSINPELFLEKDFKRYQIIALLHKSAESVLYKVVDSKSNKIVVLRILLEDDEHALTSYPDCIKSIQKLRHPNLIKILSLGTRPQKYYTLEYVKGSSLQKLIGSYRYKKIAAIFYKVAMAFHFVHQHDILHKNITLECVKLNENLEPKILGLELASLYRDSNLLLESKDTNILKYASPERILQSVVDIRSDIYSLGGVLYHVLTGRQPFSGKKNSITNQIINNTPIKPTLLNPEIPEYLEKVCLNCLEKSPDKRYSTMEWFAFDLKNYIDGESLPASKSPSKWKFFYSGYAIASIFFLVFLFSLWFVREQQLQKNIRAQSDQIAILTKKSSQVNALLAKKHFSLKEWDFASKYGIKSIEHAAKGNLDIKSMTLLTVESIALGQLQWNKKLSQYKNAKLNLDESKVAILANNNQIDVFDVATGMCFSLQSTGKIDDFAFDGDNILYYSENKLFLYFSENSTHKELYSFSSPGEFVHLENDGKLIVFSGKELQVWNKNTQKFIAHWDVEAHDVVISDDNSYLVTINYKKIIVWNLLTQLPEFSCESNLQKPIFRFGSQNSFAIYLSNAIDVYDANKKLVKQLKQNNVVDFVFSQHNEYLFVLTEEYIFKYETSEWMLCEILPARNTKKIMVSGYHLICCGDEIVIRTFNSLKITDVASEIPTEEKINSLSYDFIDNFHCNIDYLGISTKKKYAAVCENGRLFIWDIEKQNLCGIVCLYKGLGLLPIRKSYFAEETKIVICTDTSQQLWEMDSEWLQRQIPWQFSDIKEKVLTIDFYNEE